MPAPSEMTSAPEEISPVPQQPPVTNTPATDTLDISGPTSSLSHEASSSTWSSQTRSGDVVPEQRKPVTNLASLAARVVRHRKSNHEVRYYSQVDMQSVTVRRSKFGKKRTEMLVALDGIDLTISRANAKPRDENKPMRKLANGNNVHRNKPKKKLVLNVRDENVQVDVEKMELVVHKDGRERPIRLQIADEDLTRRWDMAINSARTCDIEQFYELGKLLGRGAYGQVFEAIDVCTQEKRAAKIVHRSSNLKSVEHLSREIEVMKSISHPGIVETYQIFDLKRKIYIVMECVPGGDLFDFVAKQEVLTEAQGSKTMRKILEAVAYLHDRNIVHRDLKPENILCAQDAWPLDIKITDFGFSSILDEGSIDNLMRTPVGTAYFMAPEIITHQGHGPPVDLWACGVILYTILTGRLPFPGRNRDEYFRNVTDGAPRFPQSLWKGISTQALNLVKGLLNTDPKKRLNAIGAMSHDWIASADEFASDTAEIKRNRANLHSTRRRLYKAKSAIIAVAMAQKFRATSIVDLVEKFPIAVDKARAGATKISQKTADKVMDSGDRIGDGAKKIGENVGEGTKKAVEGVKSGAKKSGQKVGEGVKKTGEGIANGAKKTKENVKKTGEGIAKGAKKTKESVGTGVKKAGDGVKKAGEGIKKGAEKVKIDKEKLEKLKIPLEKVRQRRSDNQSGSTSNRGSAGTRRRDRVIHRRRRRARVGRNNSESTRGVESEASADLTGYPTDNGTWAEGSESDAVRDDGAESTSRGLRSIENLRADPTSPQTQSRGVANLFSQQTESPPPDDEFVDAPPAWDHMTEPSMEVSRSLIVSDDIIMASPDTLQHTSSEGADIAKHTSQVSNTSGETSSPVTSMEVSKPFVAADGLPASSPSKLSTTEAADIVKHTSQVSNESGGSGQVASEDEKISAAPASRPKLPPLIGLIGIPPPDICDLGDSGGSSDDMELLGEDSAAAGDKLRQAAAMLLGKEAGAVAKVRMTEASTDSPVSPDAPLSPDVPVADER